MFAGTWFMDYPNKRNCRSLTSTPIVASERSSVSPISSERMDNLGRDSDEIATLHDQNGRTQNFGEGEEFRANDESGEGNYTNDRLSDLPNSLLIHILSFLEIRKTVITSVLSKRWRTLWADLPSLEFSVISGNKEETSKLVSMIDRALVIRTVSNLDMLSVCFAYDECFASDVNAWVEFVVMNKVKVVRLMLNPSKAFYTLPQIMFSNSSLTSLSIRGCVMAPQKTIEWPSLTELVIEHVELPQRVVEEILSSCPVLRSLYLSLCWGFSCLKINFPSLCELTVKDFHVEKSGPLLEISAPYLRTLVIDLFPNGRKLQLNNMSSLVSAYIRFPGGTSYQGMNNMKKLYEDIRHVEELKLGKRAFKVVSRLVVSGWPLPQSRFRRLLVTTSRNEFSFTGLMSLLESSVDLEELTILGTMREEGAISWSPSVRGDLVRDLLHLKTVKISEFADPNGEPLLTTARILLKRATMLEKIVVNYGTFGVSTISSSNFRRIAETLSSYPRSSQKLKVIIHH